MSSYLSNILTSTTSRYNTLRRTLLDNEADGDTEDDTHVSRVLRAYYTEKGRPFPPWLPPDPNDKRATTPQPQFATQQSSYFSRNHYGAAAAPAQSAGGGGRAGLGDLWDTPSQTSAPQQPQSLRAGRRPVAPQAGSSLAPPAPAQARPLPSQRAGSHQSLNSQQPADSSPAGSSANLAGGGSASDRLKQRLWGGRAGSPMGSPGLGQTQNPMDRYGGGGGGGGYR